MTGPPAFDSGPSPYLTQEATSSAQPPSTDEEAESREQRIQSARQRFEDAKESASTAQASSDVAQEADEPPDIDEIKLRYVAEVGEITIDPVDIEYQLAGQSNCVLREVQLILKHEGIPQTLQSHPGLLLSLCAEFGQDEENDAEARAYLDYCANGGSRLIRTQMIH